MTIRLRSVTSDSFAQRAAIPAPELAVDSRQRDAPERDEGGAAGRR